MIGHLTGILMEKQPPEILLDVQGVGYELLLPMTSFYHLPEVGKQTSLFTHLVVRKLPLIWAMVLPLHPLRQQ